jgi:hypothetical protein
MFEKTALSSDMIVAFLKDANVTGATVDAATKKIVLHVDEDSPDVAIDLTTMLALYVEKVAGKDLSTNDLTDELLARLNATQDQVQVNWNELDTNNIAYIRNKPNVYLPDDTLRAILNELSDDGTGNLLYKNLPIDSVQPDWTETNPAHKTYIKNKPTLHEHTNKALIDALGETATHELTYNGIVVSGAQSDWSQTDTTNPAYIKNKPTLYNPANMDVLNALDINADNELTYNGVAVDTQDQPDWNETNIAKPWFIRNKPDVYLPTQAVRDTLDEFSTVAGRVNWNGNEIAYTDELIVQASTQTYGIVSDIVITTI